MESITGAVLLMLTEVEMEPEAPYPSATDAVQMMLSPGCTRVGAKVNVSVEPKVVVPTVHSYVTVRLSPSGSLTVAAQVRVLLVSIAVDGVIDILLKEGAEFPTITLALDVFCSVEESVAVMVHSIMSVG